MVLKVGVTCARYVSLNNARPWVIHAYRNIKGRGLHLDEDAENTVPIEKVDEKHIRLATLDPHPYLYTESAAVKEPSVGDCLDDRIAKKQECSEDTPILKKMKFNASGKEESEKNKHEDDEVITCEKRSLPVEKDKEAVIVAKRRRLDRISTALQEQTTVCGKNKTGAGDNTEQVGKGIISAQETSTGDEEGKTADTEYVKNAVDKTDANVEKDAENDTVAKEKTDENKETGANDGLKNAETNEEMQTRRTRKRKHPQEAEKSKAEGAPAISTYDKVRLVIQPWRKPEGSINKPILKMMMESVMLFLMMNPGSPEDSLVQRYTPYLQPMILRNIVDILEDIGCITRQYIKKTKTTLFSKPSLPKIGIEEEEDTTVLMVPAEDCVIKMGLFGQEIFPNAKWPENTHPKNKIM